MAFIDLTCPHCETKKVIFAIRSSVSLHHNVHKLFCQCRNCRDVVVVSGTFRNEIPERDLDQNIRISGFVVMEVLPALSEPISPPGTPEDVARHFIEGLKVLSVEAFPSAGNCFRTTLEKATNHLLKGAECDTNRSGKLTLYERIESLRNKNIIAPSIYEWAGIIRKLGNMGTHGDADFTQYEANELRHFTEQFLHYVFSMPERVNKIRSELENSDVK